MSWLTRPGALTQGGPPCPLPAFPRCGDSVRWLFPTAAAAPLCRGGGCSRRLGTCGSRQEVTVALLRLRGASEKSGGVLACVQRVTSSLFAPRSGTSAA